MVKLKKVIDPKKFQEYLRITIYLQEIFSLYPNERNSLMLVSIIIPVYNEEQYIKELLIKVNSIKNIKKEVIVINDKSDDNTQNILEQDCNSLYSKLINNKKNMGKGYSCREGIKVSSGEIILIQDADLEYNPENYQRLIDPIMNNDAKVVYGSRVLPGGQRTRPKTFDFVISILLIGF